MLLEGIVGEGVELDTAVRRIPATKKAEAKADRETYGTIKLLEDTHGDGQFDRVTVFAERLPACYGVIAARDGVIALCAPGPRYAKSMTIREDIIPAEYNSASKVQKKIDASANPNRIDFHLTKGDAGKGK